MRRGRPRHGFCLARSLTPLGLDVVALGPCELHGHAGQPPLCMACITVARRTAGPRPGARRPAPAAAMSATPRLLRRASPSPASRRPPTRRAHPCSMETRDRLVNLSCAATAQRTGLREDLCSVPRAAPPLRRPSRPARAPPPPPTWRRAAPAHGLAQQPGEGPCARRGEMRSSQVHLFPRFGWPVEHPRAGRPAPAGGPDRVRAEAMAPGRNEAPACARSPRCARRSESPPWRPSSCCPGDDHTEAGESEACAPTSPAILAHLPAPRTSFSKPARRSGSTRPSSPSRRGEGASAWPWMRLALHRRSRLRGRGPRAGGRRRLALLSPRAVVFPSVRVRILLSRGAGPLLASCRIRGMEAIVLAASYLFYAAASPAYCLLMSAVTLVNPRRGAGHRAPDERAAKRITASRWRWIWRARFSITTASSLMRVVAFSTPGVGHAAALLTLALPIGLFLHHLPTISYVVDVKRGLLPPASTLDFALYLSFFPHVVAGLSCGRASSSPSREAAQHAPTWRWGRRGV